MNVRPYPGTNAQIEVIANQLRANVVAPEDNEVSSGAMLRSIVERLGGSIVVVDDPSVQEADGGSLVIRGERDFTVYLSPYTTPLRDNFTIGHELGHYVLHYRLASPLPPTPLGFARYGSTLVEWQANRFSAALLMPEDPFRQAYGRFTGDLSVLSGWFDVSKPAVEVRAKSLGLLSS